MLHTYACDGDWLLSNFSQTVLTVAELIARLKSAKYYVNYDFIYIIDANGKLRFSPSIDSLHKQISGAKKVCGAGEIYFHKNIHGIEVNLINNKSGAYLPGDEFLIPMQEFFGALGFITSETQLLDERANLIENRVKLTGNFRNNLAF